MVQDLLGLDIRIMFTGKKVAGMFGQIVYLIKFKNTFPCKAPGDQVRSNSLK
jgi:hypothetical protein